MGLILLVGVLFTVKLLTDVLSCSPCQLNQAAARQSSSLVQSFWMKSAYLTMPLWSVKSLSKNSTSASGIFSPRPHIMRRMSAVDTKPLPSLSKAFFQYSYLNLLNINWITFKQRIWKRNFNFNISIFVIVPTQRIWGGTLYSVHFFLFSVFGDFEIDDFWHLWYIIRKVFKSSFICTKGSFSELFAWKLWGFKVFQNSPYSQLYRQHVSTSNIHRSYI